MTGELTLTGRVLPIGGLREKSTAAWNAGIKRVLIPADNVTDLEEIDPTVRQNLLFIPCRRASQVLDEILVHPVKGTEHAANIAEKSGSDAMPAPNARVHTSVQI